MNESLEFEEASRPEAGIPFPEKDPPSSELDRLLGKHRLIGHLAAFHYAAQAGSLHRAAKELGLNRNSLSRYLDELEAAAGGIPLRDSSGETRGLALTEAGRRLARLLEPLFEGLETVANQFVGGVQELRLGCQTSTSCYLLPDWIRAFGASRNPNPGPPRFSLKTGNSESILDALRGLEVDVGIVASDYGRARTEHGIAYHPLFRETLVAIRHRDAPLPEPEPIPAERFVRHPQYLYYRGGERYQERIDSLAPGKGASRQMEFDTITAIKETVRAGLGVSIIPSGVIRNEDREWLSRVRLEAPPERAAALVRAIAVATREHDDLTPLAREFLLFLKSRSRDLAGPVDRGEYEESGGR